MKISLFTFALACCLMLHGVESISQEVYSYEDLLQLSVSLPQVLPNLPTLQTRLKVLIEATQEVVDPKPYRALSKSDVDALIQLQQLINKLKSTLPKNATVQTSSDAMIAEVQKILNSSAIIATQSLADLSSSLPSTLPAFPVINRKVRVLYEAAYFALDSTATTTTTKTPPVTTQRTPPALSSSDRNLITQVLAILQELKPKLPQTSSVLGAYNEAVAEIQKTLA